MLDFAAKSPDQLNEVLGPVTLSAHELIAILGHTGGAKSLAAASAYLGPLFERRMGLCLEGQVEKAIDLASGALTKNQLVRILSHDGAVHCLVTALAYLDTVGEQRAKLSGAGYTSDQIKQVLAPVVLDAEDLISMQARNGGLNRLKMAINYLKPRCEQRLSFCLSNQFEEAITQGPGGWTKEQVIVVLSKGGAIRAGGGEQLPEFAEYLAHAARVPRLFSGAN